MHGNALPFPGSCLVRVQPKGENAGTWLMKVGRISSVADTGVLIHHSLDQKKALTHPESAQYCILASCYQVCKSPKASLPTSNSYRPGEVQSLAASARHTVQPHPRLNMSMIEGSHSSKVNLGRIDHESSGLPEL